MSRGNDEKCIRQIPVYTRIRSPVQVSMQGWKKRRRRIRVPVRISVRGRKKASARRVRPLRMGGKLGQAEGLELPSRGRGPRFGEG
eukprot:6371057-Pyramimonas_sp.AAC.1